MRLLNTYTGQFEDKNLGEVDYAILSHRWDDVEQTHQEVRDIQKSFDGTQIRPSATFLSQPFSRRPSRRLVTENVHPVHDIADFWGDPNLSSKIRNAAEVARKDGHLYIWIDSCCIDKTSSSELSESINSMYKWYGHAKMCYAYLNDVPFAEKTKLEAKSSDFRKSRWFTRGWTLQELIAPLYVTFLSSEWEVIDLIEAITRIPDLALLHFISLGHFSVAQRFSWSAERNTTRVEDKAYSLLGIFDINMPALYGEGARAFLRLQEEILRRVPDQSFCAWKTTTRDIYEQERRIENLETRVEEYESRLSEWRQKHFQDALPSELFGGTTCNTFILDPILCSAGRHQGISCQRCKILENDRQMEFNPEIDPEPHERHWRELNSQLNLAREELKHKLNVANRERLNAAETQRQGPVSFFANSPADFTWGGNEIGVCSHVELSQRLQLHPIITPPEYIFTPHGIRTTFPMIPLSLCASLLKIIEEFKEEVPLDKWFLVILCCKHKDHPDDVLGRVCYFPSSNSGIEYIQCSAVRTADSAKDEPESLFLLPPNIIEHCHGQIEVKTVYIPHPDHGTGETRKVRHQFHEKIHFILPSEVHEDLGRQDYASVRLDFPVVKAPNPLSADETLPTCSLTHPDHEIVITYKCQLKNEGQSQKMIIDAHVRVSSTGDPVTLDVQWSDQCSSNKPWKSLPDQEVKFTILGRQRRIVLSLKYAPHSYYAIFIKVHQDTQQEQNHIAVI